MREHSWHCWGDAQATPPTVTSEIPGRIRQILPVVATGFSCNARSIRTALPRRNNRHQGIHRVRKARRNPASETAARPFRAAGRIQSRRQKLCGQRTPARRNRSLRILRVCRSSRT